MTESRHSSTVSRRLSEHEALSKHFSDDLDEGQINEMWRRIDHAPVGSRRPWLWVLVAAALVLLLVASFFRTERGAEPRQLALTSGSTPTVLSADDTPSASRFDDGSQVSLAAGTRLEVLRNDTRSFVTALRRGGVTFDVKPGGPRRWVIEAGELSVEVVGTRFRVERGQDRTRVSVEHGAGDPARAAAILRSSLPDMPQALLEDASVRLVEAEKRAGHRDAAARAAADYLRRFPGGQRADEVRSWSEP